MPNGCNGNQDGRPRELRGMDRREPVAQGRRAASPGRWHVYRRCPRARPAGHRFPCAVSGRMRRSGTSRIPFADAGRVFTLADISPVKILEAGPELAIVPARPLSAARGRARALCRPGDCGLPRANTAHWRKIWLIRCRWSSKNCPPSSTLGSGDAPRFFCAAVASWPDNAFNHQRRQRRRRRVASLPCRFGCADNSR